MLEECATRDTTAFSNAIEMQKQQVEKLQKKQAGLRAMRAVGDITREEFLRDNEQIKQELQSLELQIADLQVSATAQESPSGLDLERIQSTLDQWIDFSVPVISDALIEQFILQVVIVDDNTFNWTLDFSGEDDSEQSSRMRPSEVALQLYREQQKRKKDGVDIAIDTMLSRHITNPRTLFPLLLQRPKPLNTVGSVKIVSQIGLQPVAGKSQPAI